MNIYNILHDLDITYEEVEHKAIFTIEEALQEKIYERINGVECKNLFVKNKKHYYLIFIEASKRANLKEIASLINESKLTFATTTELKEILGLDIGSVTPLGIINDKDNKVILLLDKSLRNSKVLVHPNINTKTISISYEDLLKIINYTKHKYLEF